MEIDNLPLSSHNSLDQVKLLLGKTIRIKIKDGRIIEGESQVIFSKKICVKLLTI